MHFLLNPIILDPVRVDGQICFCSVFEDSMYYERAQLMTVDCASDINIWVKWWHLGKQMQQLLLVLLTSHWMVSSVILVSNSYRICIGSWEIFWCSFIILFHPCWSPFAIKVSSIAQVPFIPSLTSSEHYVVGFCAARKLAYLYRLPTNEHKAKVALSWLAKSTMDSISFVQNEVNKALSPKWVNM